MMTKERTQTAYLKAQSSLCAGVGLRNEFYSVFYSKSVLPQDLFAQRETDSELKPSANKDSR